MKDKKTRKMMAIALTSSLAYLLMLIETPLPFFPIFLKMDLSDLPALIIAIHHGPLTGVLVELIKNILHGITAGSTAYIGETANFLLGSIFVSVSSYIFLRRKSGLSYVWGSAAATTAMSLSAVFLNYALLLPLYEKVLGFPLSAIIESASKVNSGVTGTLSFLFLAIFPFNMLKGIILSAAGYYTAGKMRLVRDKK